MQGSKCAGDRTTLALKPMGGGHTKSKTGAISGPQMDLGPNFFKKLRHNKVFNTYVPEVTILICFKSQAIEVRES